MQISIIIVIIIVNVIVIVNIIIKLLLKPRCYHAPISDFVLAPCTKNLLSSRCRRWKLVKVSEC